MPLGRDQNERQESELERRQRKLERRQKRYQAPLLPALCKLLLVMLGLLVVVFGALDLPRVIQGAFPASVYLHSLLLGGLVPGLPLLLICGIQLRRIQKGRSKESPKGYRVWLLVTAITLGAVLAAWLVALVVQAFA